MKFTFIVLINDKIWQRYTRRPHYSALAELGDLIVIEYPLTILSKKFLKRPLREIKYYLKYSWSKRIDTLSGAKIIRPIILFPSILENPFCEFINRKLVALFLFSIKAKNSKEIYFLTYYNQAWLIAKKNYKRFILDMNDEWSMIEYDDLVKEKIKKLTFDIIAKVDLVLTVTKRLRNKYNCNAKIFYLPNAVDINHYVPSFDTKTKKTKEPSLIYDKEFLSLITNDPRKYIKSIDLIKEIKNPAVGSISGLAGNWSDFDFMAKVEELLPPEFNLLSTGNIGLPTKQDFLPGYFKYISKNRMRFLGHLDYSILPDFLGKINVGIVMHRMDEFNTHSAPNKIWAYLAMGLPVVSTNFLTEPDKEIFEGMVSFANTPEEYVEYIVYAYENDSQELKIKRRRLAVKNSTFNRAKKIVNIFKEKLNL